MPQKTSNAIPRSVEWILRVGVAMEFLGHGMLGFGRPAPWAIYFGVVGIAHDTAYALMPWVAAFDVSMAAVALFYPVRALVLYMAAWGLWTALLRPLAGEPFWEALERAGNYGAPWALFLILSEASSGERARGNVARMVEEKRRAVICWVLRLTTVALLLGHGALGLLVRKPLLESHYSAVGLHLPTIEPWVGALEMVLALAVLLKPDFRLLVFVFAWKIATELLSPLAGSPFWVFIEHGGSYAAPLALAFLQVVWLEETEASSPPADAAVGLDEILDGEFPDPGNQSAGQ